MSEELKNVDETQEVWSNFIHDFIEEDIIEIYNKENKNAK